MKFVFGLMLGTWLGMLIAGLWIHTRWIPQQSDYQTSLMRCNVFNGMVSEKIGQIVREM